MVVFADEFEKCHSSSRVDLLESIRGHCVSFEIEREAYVLQEKGKCGEAIKELTDFLALGHLKPGLLLLAKGGLRLVFETTKAEVFRVGTSIGSNQNFGS